MLLGFFVFGSWWQSRCAVWIICWCYLLVVSGVTARTPKRRYAEDSALLRAQCKAQCLKKFVHDVIDRAVNDSNWRKLERFLHSRPDLILPHCRKLTKPQLDCNQCLDKGCEAEIRSMKDCRSYCKGNAYCKFGCDSLVELYKEKPGHCPKATIRDADCYLQCKTDSGCGMALHKCCKRGCGRRCVAPQPPAQALPLVSTTHIWEVERKRQLDMELVYHNNSDYRNPALFVVQVSIYVGKHFRWQYASKWESLFITTGTHSGLGDLRIGVWYRFRIAAVSADGTRGFAVSTPPAQLSEKPQPPTAPRNVTDGTWRIHASGNINVEITWSPPLRSDLPLTAYRILWVKDLGYVQSDGQSLEGLTKFKKTIPPDQKKYTIQNLESDTSYKVQVVAYAKWGEVILESQANTLFITAPTLKTSGHDGADSPSKNDAALGDGCRCGRDSSRQALTDKNQRLHIYKPEFEVDSLNLRILLLGIRRGEDIPYVVDWKPEVCIAAAAKPEPRSGHSPLRGVMKSRFFKITGLSFNCRYSLVLTPLGTSAEKSAVIRSCFCTPSCRDVKLADPKHRPVCYVDDAPLLPSKPEHVKSRLIDRKAMHYLLRWREPRKSHPFNKYRVMWGPREEEPVNKDMYGDKNGLSPKLDFQYAEIKVMPKNITSLILRNLKRATLYIAKVQTLSYNNGKESESSEAVHYFTTEGFTNPVSVYEPHGIVSKYIKPHGVATVSTRAIPFWTMLCSSTLVVRIVTRYFLDT